MTTVNKIRKHKYKHEVIKLLESGITKNIRELRTQMIAMVVSGLKDTVAFDKVINTLRVENEKLHLIIANDLIVTD
jgi:hypothetical protein